MSPKKYVLYSSNQWYPKIKILYPNRTHRHLKNPYKAHKYRLCRDLPFYSNSSADSVNWLFFYVFSWFYYSHSLKNSLVFVPLKIFRAKIEPRTDFLLNYLYYMVLAPCSYVLNKELPYFTYTNLWFSRLALWTFSLPDISTIRIIFIPTL